MAVVHVRRGDVEQRAHFAAQNHLSGAPETTRLRSKSRGTQSRHAESAVGGEMGRQLDPFDAQKCGGAVS